MLTSGNGRTLLMIAAASSDPATFMACGDALIVAVTPEKVSVSSNTSDILHLGVGPMYGLRQPEGRDRHCDNRL